MNHAPAFSKAVDSLVGFLALLAAGPALGQTFEPPPPGQEYTVNGAPGNQTGPHVSGDLVSYSDESSGGSQIRYHDLATGVDSAIANGGAFDFLSDVAGGRIVFTRVPARGPRSFSSTPPRG